MTSFRYTALVLVAFALLSSRGCSTDISDGLIAIQRDGTGLQIAVCEAVSSDHVTMEERTSDGERWYFWETKSPVDLLLGAVISPTNGEVLGVPNGQDPRMEPGDTLFILFRGRDGVNASHDLSGTFTIPSDGLSGDAWLHTDETVTDAPCM